LAVGVTQVILTGGTDLSSGSVVALSAMIAATSRRHHLRAVFRPPPICRSSYR
jgi:ribose/xylose/arabinose/galactoside ABC-type transport system permease subunit